MLKDKKGRFLGSDRNYYTKEEFINWLKNYPEIKNRTQYGIVFRMLKDPRLHNDPLRFYKDNTLFGNGIRKKTDGEMIEWLKEHPEIVSPKDYKDKVNSFNDPTLRSRLDKSFFLDNSNVPYSKDEMIEWKKQHPEIDSLTKFNQYFKNQNPKDPRLISNINKYYGEGFFKIANRNREYYDKFDFDEIKGESDYTQYKKYWDENKDKDKKLPSPEKAYELYGKEIFGKTKKLNKEEFESYCYDNDINCMSDFQKIPKDVIKRDGLPSNPYKFGKDIFDKNSILEYLNRNEFNYFLDEYNPSGIIEYTKIKKDLNSIYNGKKLHSSPFKFYNDSTLFGSYRYIDKYNKSEFYNFMDIHDNPFDNYQVYQRTYKDYKDPKLPCNPLELYGEDVFGNYSAQRIGKEKKEFFDLLSDADFSIYERFQIAMTDPSFNNTEHTIYEIVNHHKDRIKRQGDRKFSVKKSTLGVNLDDLMDNIKLNNYETYVHIIKNRINKIWDDIISGRIDFIKDIKKVVPAGLFNTEIKNKIVEEYKFWEDFTSPNGFDYRLDDGNKIKPNMMQVLYVLRCLQSNKFANWSLAGTGKTVADILLSRLVSHLTLIIVPNDLKEQWKDNIVNAYKDSIVYIIDSLKDFNNIKIDYNKHNYFIINYEKFQLFNTIDFIEKLLSYNIDKVTYDEVQFIKISNHQVSARRKNIDNFLQRCNPKYVQILSATPVTNNLIEPKSLIEMLTDKEFNEITGRKSINNLVTVNFFLNLHGIRFKNKPNCPEPIIHDNFEIEVPGLLNELVYKNDDGKWYYKNKSYVDDLKSLLPYKLELSKDKVRGKTIVYTTWKDDVANKTVRFYENLGYKVKKYTGDESDSERKIIKNGFVNGDVDILVCTSPIATGVDDLQKVCHNMVILYLPWTYTLFYQLVCRLYRTGQKNTVNVWIPKVYFYVDGVKWCYDDVVLNKINVKRKMSDYSIDDEIIEIIEKNEKLVEKINKNFRKCFIDFINGIDPEFVRTDRKKIDAVEPNDINYSPIQCELRQAMTSYSWNYEKHVNDNIDIHNEYLNNRMNDWEIIPIEHFIKKLDIKENEVVVDAGCGDIARVERLLPNNLVYSYDLNNSNDEKIIKRNICDITPHSNNVDRVFHSQCWENLDFHKSIENAYIELKDDGKLHAIQGVGGWSKHKDKFNKALRNAKFRLLDSFEDCGFIFMTFEKIV